MDKSTINRRVLRPNDVAKKLGVSLTTLWRMRKHSDFPEPINIPGVRAVGWDSNVIDLWISQNFSDGEQ